MVKKWPSVQTFSIPSFDFSRHTKPNLDDIDWSTATVVKKSRDGAMGVYYVGFSDGSAVVVKVSGSPANELFCSRLALHMAVCLVPDMRIYKRAEGPGLAIYNKLMSIEQGYTLQGLFREYFLVMEYCSGCTTLETFETNNVITSSCFKTIGRVAVFDMLLRITDRFPFVVDNSGNPGNVLLRSSDSGVFAIDNTASCIDLSKYEERAMEYANRVSEFVRNMEELHKSGELSSRPLKACGVVRDLILEFSLVDVGPQATIDVQTGAWEMIVEMDSISMDLIRDELEKMDSDLSTIPGIDLRFISMLLSAFHSRGAGLL